MEYAIQVTASVWEPLEQVHCVVSGDVDFDSFGMAPWGASGMHGGGCRFCEMFWTMMFQWLIRLSCRPVIINGLDRTMRMNTEYGHERIMTTNTDSPRLAVTPGEWYASEMLTMMTTDLRQLNGFTEMIGAIYNCRTVGGFPQIDSAAANCGGVELDDLIFCRTSFPLDELSAGRVGDYIWLELWTGLSVRNRSVTGSLAFGSSQRHGRCCLWLAALPFCWIGSADVPLCRHPVWPDGEV